jgi:vacuolar-type H+-ATPase subunit F/Vma7
VFIEGLGASILGKIALIADRTTTAYFKVSGIRNSFAVEDREDAERIFKRVHSDESISLIMVAEPVYEWIRPALGKMRKQFPLVVSIPTRDGPKAQVDALAELIKRTVGIELKMT